MPRQAEVEREVTDFMRAQNRHRTIAGIARGAQCSNTSVRRLMRQLEAAGRVSTDRNSWPYAYRLLPPPAPDISCYYLTDPGDPQAPQSASEYASNLGRGTIWPGDRVAYENPAWQDDDGRYQTGGMDGPLTVTAIVALGGGVPFQAILNDGEWEVSAAHLRRLTLLEQMAQDNEQASC